MAKTAGGPESAKRVTIKKYANRRLYDTESSSYITLDKLAAMIRDGREFEVVDAKSGEDITHNVFAKLITAIHRYEPREVPFAAWITRVARNAALDHLRARRQIPFEEVRTTDEGHEQVGFDRSQSLREAFHRLPQDQREVLVLRHIAGLTPSEIAERIGKTESSVHGLHHRGRGALQAALRELEAATVDRFGPLPDETRNLLTIVETKINCRKACIAKLDAGAKGAVLTFIESGFPDLPALLGYVERLKGQARLRPDSKLVISREWPSGAARLNGALQISRGLSRVLAAGEKERELEPA